MDFHYPFAHLPADQTTVQDVHAAAVRLAGKLRALDLQKLDISDNNKRYFGNHVRNLRSTMRHFTHLLSWVMADHPVPYGQFVFVDYGGGDGTFSLLARELGVGTVIYIDIYEPSCRDAQAIGAALGLEAQHYLHGELPVLLDFVRREQITCHGLGSYDVIEHIYNIEQFLAGLGTLSVGPLTVVLASGANPRNRKVRNKLMEFQRKAEHGGRTSQKGYKPTFCTTAYELIRKEIIQKCANDLPAADVDQLVKATRGKISRDITATVDAYRRTGQMPPMPEHPTNTCNPNDGNWCERLMEPAWLAELLSNAGFATCVLAGYYGGSADSSLLKRIAISLVNPAITLLGQAGLALAPCYIVRAQKNNSVSVGSVVSDTVVGTES